MFTFLGRSVCLSVCRSVEKIEKAVKIGDFKHDQERKDEEEEEQDKDEKEGKDEEEKEEEKEEKKEEEKEEKKEEGNSNNEDKDKVKDADNDGKFFSLTQDILLFTLLSFLMDQR